MSRYLISKYLYIYIYIWIRIGIEIEIEMDIFSLVQTACAQFMQWSLAMYDEQV